MQRACYIRTYIHTISSSSRVLNWSSAFILYFYKVFCSGNALPCSSPATKHQKLQGFRGVTPFHLTAVCCSRGCFAFECDCLAFVLEFTVKRGGVTSKPSRLVPTKLWKFHHNTTQECLCLSNYFPLAMGPNSFILSYCTYYAIAFCVTPRTSKIGRSRSWSWGGWRSHNFGVQ